MKPTDITSKNGSRFPLTDCNYHAPLSGGSCARFTNVPSNSFWRFSRDYFAVESDRSFMSEAIVFAVLAITAAVPMLQNASAIRELIRAFGA